MDKFVEQAKDQLLYEYQDRDDDVKLMLDTSRANRRINEQMGRWTMAVRNVTLCWRGRWHDLLGDCYQELELNYLNLNGFSRVQAIEMKGRSTIAEREAQQQKERGGLLGMLPGGK